jgi:hypothetical protein
MRLASFVSGFVFLVALFSSTREFPVASQMFERDKMTPRVLTRTQWQKRQW